MKNIYIILGEAHAGKSTLVRSLTGLRAEGAVKIQMNNKAANSICVYAFMCAAQEEQKHNHTPENLFDFINDNEYKHFLIPLRYNGKITNGEHRPDAQQYIDLLNKNCNILGIALLSQTTIPLINIPTSVTQIECPYSHDSAVNFIANKVRNGWAWL